MEDKKKMEKENEERKRDVHTTLNITNNFNAPVGQHIDHVDTINFRMDKDGTFHFGHVDNVKEEEKSVSSEQLARAIENCQEYFWANSAYAVVYCLLRDDYKKTVGQTAFESMVELLPYKKVRDHRCPPGTIANAFSDNTIYKLHVNKWRDNGASQRILDLLNRLRKELEL